MVLHPHIDPHSILLVQLFSLNAVYTPDPSGQRQGSVTSHSGGQPDPDALSPLGWAALPLFQGAYACTGVHHTPLFEGTPDAAFLGSVSSCPVKNALAEGLKRKSQKLLKNFVSLAVKVWDGHYFDDERHDLPVIDDLLTVGNMKKFQKTQASKSGKDMSQLVLQSFDRKIRKQGRNSAEYQREERFYEDAMADAFYTLMVSITNSQRIRVWITELRLESILLTNTQVIYDLISPMTLINQTMQRKTCLKCNCNVLIQNGLNNALFEEAVWGGMVCATSCFFHI